MHLTSMRFPLMHLFRHAGRQVAMWHSGGLVRTKRGVEQLDELRAKIDSWPNNRGHHGPPLLASSPMSVNITSTRMVIIKRRGTACHGRLKHFGSDALMQEIGSDMLSRLCLKGNPASSLPPYAR